MRAIVKDSFHRKLNNFIITIQIKMSKDKETPEVRREKMRQEELKESPLAVGHNRF